MTASENAFWDLEVGPALREFIASNLVDGSMCIDWVCQTFDIPLSEELFEQVYNEYESSSDVCY